MRVLPAVLLACLIAPAPAAGATSPAASRPASGHPMRYWVAPPPHWSASRTWPVVVVITDATRQFELALDEFARAPGGDSAVVVVPATLGSGGTAQNVKQAYPYDAAAWARAAKDGNCAFDDDGIAAVLADVRSRWHTEDRATLTGLEAAGHVVLAQAFVHPERWRAVYAVAPNWQGRCVGEAAWSHDPGRATLPIVVLHGERDTLWTRFMSRQGDAALAAARAHGFATASDRSVPARGHEFLPDVVLAAMRAQGPMR